MDRLTNMEAFVRVVEAQSFSAAARNWGLSKAAVSKYVGALEAHLGVELLQRTTRSLRLTEVGRTYHARCVDLLDEIGLLERTVRNDAGSPRGLLRVTAPPGFTTFYAPQVTTEFRARYPEVRLDLLLTHRMVDLVEEGMDVAIRVTDPEDSSLVARRLAPAPLVAVASPDYLRRRGTPTRPQQLLTHDCLVDTNFRHGGRWRFREHGRRRVVEVDGPIRVNSPAAIRQLAIAHQGVALVAEFIVRDALEAGSLVEVLPGTLDYAWSIYAVYPRRRYLPARVRVFVDHLAQVLAKGVQTPSAVWRDPER